MPRARKTGRKRRSELLSEEEKEKLYNKMKGRRDE